MARLTLKTIEHRLATMKRCDNRWTDAYVRDVSHLLREREQFASFGAAEYKRAIEDAAKVAEDTYSNMVYKPAGLRIAAAIRSLVDEGGTG